MEFHLINSPGSNFKEVVELAWSEVYVPKNDAEGAYNNVVRYAQDIGHINLLADSMQNGVDPTQHPPVVIKLRTPKIVAGKVYLYQLVVGFHRMAAGKKTNYEKWPFAVYEFDSDRAMFNFQRVENNHSPARAATADDLANSLAYEVSKGWIENNEAAMQEALKHMTNIHHSTKSSAIKKAIRLTGAYQDVLVYTFNDVKEYLDHEDNYDDDTPRYTYAGNIDPYRNACGWTVLEGYEDEFLMNAIKAFNELGKTSYFICHTKVPTEKLDLSAKRQKMISEFASLENALDQVFEYKQKHGSYPWQVEAFLPQNNLKGENTFVAAA